MTDFCSKHALRAYRTTVVALLGALLAAACGGNPAPATNPPSSTATAPAVDQPDVTQPPAAGADWQVEIVQGENVHAADGGDVSIARAPFTIRVRAAQPLAIKLNAAVSDENFLLLQPGYTFTEDCALALCTGMDVAEDALNLDGWLAVDPQSTHYLYYESPEDHRWSRATVSADGVVFERDVLLLNDTPVESHAGPALYLLLFANTGDPNVIEPGELKKITLNFE